MSGIFPRHLATLLIETKMIPTSTTKVNCHRLKKETLTQ